MIQPPKNRALILSSGKDKTRVSVFVRNNIKKAGYSADLMYFRSVRFSILDGKIEIKVGSRDLSEYKVVYFRMTKREIYRELASMISSYCHDRGIFYFDQVYHNLVLNNKLIGTYYLASSKVNQPDTIYVGKYSEPNQKYIEKSLGFPIVAKLSAGQRGQGVHLIKTSKGLATFMKKKNAFLYIYQKFIPNSYDWRVYVIGDSILLSEKRTRDAQNKKEFRNNVSVGGKKEILDAPKKVEKIAVKATKALNLTFAGIDVVEHEGKVYVFEGNRAPAFKASGRGKNNMKGLPEFIVKKLGS